jgi:YHS domain-containing protein
VSWNYTTILNIIALAGFAVLYWLYRSRGRFGGGADFATDPVCGMQVEKTAAPASAMHGGQRYYFCSDSCQQRFTTPDHGRTAEPAPTATVVDPVCGMTVDPATAQTAELDGHTYHFCSQGCRDTFTTARTRDTRGNPALSQELS